MTKQDAIKHFGGVRELASALGVSPPAIYQWEEVPPIRQVQLQRITKGKLKADDKATKPAEKSA